MTHSSAIFDLVPPEGVSLLSMDISKIPNLHLQIAQALIDLRRAYAGAKASKKDMWDKLAGAPSHDTTRETAQTAVSQWLTALCS